MSEHIEAQQAAAERLGALGLNATLMVHFPSKIKAPEGILLTTYDQLHSQIAKQETTAYAFPSFGAAQSAMRTLATTQQTVLFIYECHANTGPVEIAAKVFDNCHRHTSGGTKFMLLESFTKHPFRSTTDHIFKSVLCGRCGTVNYHPLLNI